MDGEQWVELLRYASPRSIWVVTWQNRIMELGCPFRVKVKEDIGVLKKNTVVLVSLVKISTGMITVFIIEDQAYYYYHFDILID